MGHTLKGKSLLPKARVKLARELYVPGVCRNVLWTSEYETKICGHQNRRHRGLNQSAFQEKTLTLTTTVKHGGGGVMSCKLFSGIRWRFGKM